MADNKALTELTKLQRLELGAVGLRAAGSLTETGAELSSSLVSASLQRSNADLLTGSAEAAREAGRFDVDQIRRSTAKLVAAQRTGLAARGIVIDQDSALDLVVQTEGFGAVDAITALNNAEIQAVNALNEAEVRRAAAENQEEIARLSAISSAAGTVASAGVSAQTVLGGGSLVNPKFNRKVT